MVAVKKKVKVISNYYLPLTVKVHNLYLFYTEAVKSFLVIFYGSNHTNNTKTTFDQNYISKLG